MPEQLRLSITPEALAVAFDEMSFADIFGYFVALAESLANSNDEEKSVFASLLLKMLEDYEPID